VTPRGHVIGDGNTAVWSATGDLLSPCEQRMRTKRTDVWVPIGAAVYRLALPFAQLCELERGMDTGVGRIFGQLAVKPGDDASPPRGPLEHVIALMRLSILGGGVGVRNGEVFRVSPAVALQVADALALGPVDHLVRLARLISDAVQMGRPATPEEIAAFTIPANPIPIIPAWALEYRA
jgi:hypothetical protein